MEKAISTRPKYVLKGCVASTTIQAMITAIARHADELITLCERELGGVNCHNLIGHCGDWKDYSPTVDYDAARMKIMLSGRIQG